MTDFLGVDEILHKRLLGPGDAFLDVSFGVVVASGLTGPSATESSKKKKRKRGTPKADLIHAHQKNGACSKLTRDHEGWGRPVFVSFFGLRGYKWWEKRVSGGSTSRSISVSPWERERGRGRDMPCGERLFRQCDR